MTTLTAAPENIEAPRFARQRQDDHPAVSAWVDADALAAELHAEVRGEVRFDAGSRALYASDGSKRGDHYDVSVACGERALLPEVRRADDRTLIVTDGFSCREQISQGTGREALHLAQVITMSLHGKDGGGERPEAALVEDRHRSRRRANLRAAVALAGGVVAGGLTWSVLRALGR